MIGIIGGVGPYAGLDLNRKIFDNTLASDDQGHLEVLLASLSPRIPDRTKYLLDSSLENPAQGLAQAAQSLIRSGATVLGVPCNTAHAPAIRDRLVGLVPELSGGRVKLLHMIHEVGMALASMTPKPVRVAVLSTTGTYRMRLYPLCLRDCGIDVMDHGEAMQDRVHDAIYNPDFGIKSRPNPVTNEALGILDSAIADLKSRGAQAVVLGCTELPLAFFSKSHQGLPLVDPTDILARALVRAESPGKLKP